MSDSENKNTELVTLDPASSASASSSTASPGGSVILPFKAIHTFIMSLNEEFGTKNKPLRLYARLIEQTTFSHEQPIHKHVQAFTQFCVQNREAIYEKKFENLDPPSIQYSERVFLNLKELFELADKDQRAVMWQHVLTISALVDSAGRAKQLLKEAKESSQEANFLSGLIEKVERNVNVDDTGNPLAAIGQIMNSGLITDLIGSMNDQVNTGQLDLSKMMGVVQNMIGSMTKDNPQMGQMFDSLLKTFDPAKMAEQFQSSMATSTSPKPDQ